jgi:pimeloyl-ACP methyl ester carboxylesterase
VPGPRDAAPCQPSVWPEDRGGHVWPKDREVVTDDGTRIRYVVRGPADAPWVVCVPGFLCPDTFWRDIGPDLVPDHRVVMINHRGTGASTEAGGGPHPSGAHGYTIPRLAEDIAAVIDAEAARDVVLLGHSMGVQVALELWRSRPEVVDGMVLAAGSHASPFATMYGSRVGDYLFPAASIGIPALPRAVGHRVIRAIELPIVQPVARWMRAIGTATPWFGMTAYRAHLSRLDHRTAVWTARGMHAFDATDWLGDIDVPVAVMIGTMDGWCPVEVARELADAVPAGHLEVIDGGSHTLPLEAPDRVSAQVRALTERRTSSA